MLLGHMGVLSGYVDLKDSSSPKSEDMDRSTLAGVEIQ